MNVVSFSCLGLSPLWFVHLWHWPSDILSIPWAALLWPNQNRHNVCFAWRSAIHLTVAVHVSDQMDNGTICEFPKTCCGHRIRLCAEEVDRFRKFGEKERKKKTGKSLRSSLRKFECVVSVVHLVQFLPREPLKIDLQIKTDNVVCSRVQVQMCYFPWVET